eukprot:6569642-Ditylum_brightwellii.AAC.1
MGAPCVARCTRSGATGCVVGGRRCIWFWPQTCWQRQENPTLAHLQVKAGSNLPSLSGIGACLAGSRARVG